MDVEMVDKLDRLAYRMECGAAMLLCIHDSMQRSPFGTDIYAAALSGTWDLLHDLPGELRGMIQEEKGTTI